MERLTGIKPTLGCGCKAVVMGVAVACCSVFYTFLIYGKSHLRVPRCPDKRGKDVL